MFRRIALCRRCDCRRSHGRAAAGGRAMPAVRRAPTNRAEDADKGEDPARGRDQPQFRPADPVRQRQRLGAAAPGRVGERRRARSPTSARGRWSGRSSLHGEPGRGIRIDLPRRIVLHSLSGGEVSFDDVVSDLPSMPRLDSAGNLTFRIRRASDGQRRCRRRLSRRPADHRRISLTLLAPKRIDA